MTTKLIYYNIYICIISEDASRSEAKLQELEKLLHEAEKKVSEQDIQLSSAAYQDKYQNIMKTNVVLFPYVLCALNAKLYF